MCAHVMVKYIDSYDKRTQQCHQNKAKIYSVVLGQFIEAMKNCLEVEESYKNIYEDSDVIFLLLIIKTIAYSCDSKYYPVLATHMVLIGVLLYIPIKLIEFSSSGMYCTTLWSY